MFLPIFSLGNDKKVFKDKGGAKRGLGVRTVLNGTSEESHASHPKQEGWIWRLGMVTNDLSTEEIRKWSNESKHQHFSSHRYL